MRSNKTRAVAVALLILMAVYLLLSSCDSNPMEGEPKPEEELKDYRVWFMNLGDGSKNTLYAYHPTTLEVDSANIPWRAGWGMAASADGRLLYISQYGSNVVVIDTDSLQLVAELPYNANKPVVASPDGMYIALPGDSLWILRASDYSLVFLDTIRTGHGWFSNDSRTYYCVSSHVRKIDMSNLEVTTRPFEYTSITRIIPTPDESKWLMYARLFPMYTWAFMVYDVATDSVIFADTLIPGAGSLAMTTDGRYAFYGNPGSLMMGPPSTTELDVFDVDANAIDHVIWTETVTDTILAWEFAVGDMAATPDGRWLVVLEGVSAHQLLLYDLVSEEFADYRFFGFNAISLSSPTVQRGP